MADIRKIAILTSGGDAPGMNAAVASVARFAANKNIELVGVNRGFRGLLFQSSNTENDIKPLHLETVLDMADGRGSYLRSARCTEWVSRPDKNYDAAPLHRQAADRLRAEGVDALVVIGGDGSFQGAKVLKEDGGIPFIGIPGTIDNDLGYTETTLGFDTAVTECVNAVRSVRATSRSHDRPAVVQVMGRNCGEIAIKTAKATGAEMVIVPEVEWNIDFYAQRLHSLIEAGNTRATLVVAEHCYEYDTKKQRPHMQEFDWRTYLNANGKHVGVDEEMTSERFASLLKRKGLELAVAKHGKLDYSEQDKYEVRATVVGYTQRGAIPTAQDCAFAFDAGKMAVDLLYAGQTNRVIGMRNGRVFDEDMESALRVEKLFDHQSYDLINTMEEPKL